MKLEDVLPEARKGKRIGRTGYFVYLDEPTEKIMFVLAL